MQTMNQSLATLVARRQITMEEAQGRSNDPIELLQLVETARSAVPARTSSSREP